MFGCSLLETHLQVKMDLQGAKGMHQIIYRILSNGFLDPVLQQSYERGFSILESFLLLMMWKNCNVYRNMFIIHKQDNSFRSRDANPTDVFEMKTLIGLIHLGGIYKANRLNIEDMWRCVGTVSKYFI